MTNFRAGQTLYLKRRYSGGGLNVRVTKVGTKWVYLTLGFSIHKATGKLGGIGDQRYEVYASEAAHQDYVRTLRAHKHVATQLLAELNAARDSTAAETVLKSINLLSLWRDVYHKEVTNERSSA